MTNLSVDFGYRYKNFNLFGEAGRSDNGGTAFLSGALISVGRNTDLAISYRNYTKDYQVLNANAFSEASTPINEEGIYFGIRTKLSKHFIASMYYDMWTNPWLRFQVDAPSVGKEYLFKLEYNKKRRF